MTRTEPAPHPRAVLLDAAERLLAEEGRDALTTRRIARAAGLNHGLVHYHWGSVDALLLAVADRLGRRLTARREAVFGGDAPFLDKWRAAMRSIEDELATGAARAWAEIQAMAVDRPALRGPVVEATTRIRAVLADAFAGAAREYTLSPAAADPFAALVMTFVTGMTAERLVGVEAGHASLLAWIDGMLVSLAEEAGAAR